MTNPTPDTQSISEDKNWKKEFQDKLWESGIWETLNHDQLITLDEIVTALFIKVVEEQPVLKHEKEKVVHRHGGWDWVNGAIGRNNFRLQIKQSLISTIKVEK